MSWDKLVKEFILDCPEKEKEMNRAMKYWNRFSLKDVWEVKRSDIYSYQDCFRSFLQKEIKSDSGRNKILFIMDKFYSYIIMKKKCERDDFSFTSPFDYRFDKFKTMVKYSTYREVIPKHIIDVMKEVLIESDYAFGKKFKEDYLKDVWSPSTTTFLYTILSVPIRGIQCMLLDSGLGDEYVYDFNLKDMVGNLSGQKGRREGFIRMSHYSGWSSQKRESLWITTNKSMNQGYEINFVSDELLKVIQYQIEFLMRFDLGERRSKSVVTGGLDCNLPKFHFLFRDLCVGDGMNPVSRSKVYKLWKKLCEEVERRTGFSLLSKGKCIYGLHNIRVSLISYALDQGVDLSIVSQGIAGHAGIGMTLYYYKSDKLRDRLKMAEGSKCVKSIESLRLLGGKIESK